MLQSSKLSSRFKKATKTEIKLPSKFSFSAKKTEAEIVDNVVDEADEVSRESVKKQELNISKIELELKKTLLEKINSIPVWYDYSDKKQKELISSFVESHLSDGEFIFSDEEKQNLITSLYSSVIGFGPLDYLIKQENVSAIFLNGTSNVYIDIAGKILNTEIMLTSKQLDFLVNNISNMSRIKIDSSKNVWNIKIDNLLITVIMPSVSISGINITIRKYIDSDVNYLLNNSMLSKEVYDFIIAAIENKKNIVISGDVNTGKSTLLNALLKNSIAEKRSVLAEDFPVLGNNLSSAVRVKLDRTSVDFSALVSGLIKMEPEYIITDLNYSIPEIADRKGVINTLHASSVEGCISKLVNAVVAEQNISEKLAKLYVLTNYDYIVQVNKLKDGQRCVTSVVELSPARTAALSVKCISKYSQGQYINEFPESSVSEHVESLISQAGSMSSRFLRN